MANKIQRRRFLLGASGVVVGLPFLESVAFDKPVNAQATEAKKFLFVFRQGNGVQQLDGGEPERFWPSAQGAITTASLAADDTGGRACTLNVLGEHAADLLMVRGVGWNQKRIGCGHATGIAQVLTAAGFTPDDKTAQSRGESVDWFIGKRVNPVGVEPLNLIAGPTSGSYIDAALSYSGPLQRRAAQNNPFAVYQNIFGGAVGGEGGDVTALAARRLSVNDVVREEMQSLLSRPYLGVEDKVRLQNHFDSIREIEVQMGCGLLSQADSMQMQQIAALAALDRNRPLVAELHMKLVALAFSCNMNHVAVLQMGTGNDQTMYEIDGQIQNHFHRISHRLDGDGDAGAPIPNADLLHHKIDRKIAGIFKVIIDQLKLYPGPSGGTLLADSMALWVNDLGTGSHSNDNIPHIIAGQGGGFLQTGRYIDAGNVDNNKMLNTLITGMGINAAGELGEGDAYTTFGDPQLNLAPGIIPEMLA